MSFPRYERYKDSGVEWLGDVPEHWEVNRLKLIADVFPSNVDKKEYADEVAVRLCNYTDVYYNDVIAEDMEFMQATASSQQVERFTLRSGDTILTKDSETADDIAISAYVPDDLPGVVCGYHLSIARPKPPAVGAFMKRVFDAAYIRAQAEVAANGLTRVGLSQYALDNLLVAYPGRKDQSQIAQFLNQETAKIDALVEEQRRLIELLKEKRQVVISSTVARGLNADAPMKGSGVDWIGSVPQHWEVSKLGQMGSIVRGGSPRPAGDSRFFNGDFMPWITVGEVTKDEAMYLVGTESMLTQEGASLSRTIQIGTLVLTNSGATLGVPKILEITGCANDGILAFLDLNANIEKKYLYFVLSSLTTELRERMKQGSGQPNLNTRIVSALIVPVPPLKEQFAIVVELERKQKEFEALIEQASVSMSLLRERRNALISASVTGKIDVRTFVVKPVKSSTQYSSGFAHQLLAAEILDRCNSQRMGRIKLQKLIHLCEYHGQVSEVQGDYSRKAAGPFDARAMAGISKNLKKHKWFEEVKEGERYVYRPLEKCGEHKKYLAHWQTEMPRIDEVLSLLGDFRTRECEIISTLYAAWNDLLIDGGSTDDAAILHEASSAERWHKSKEQIALERWTKALQWMKDKGLVPVGYGKHTRHTAGNSGTTPEETHEPA